MKKEKKNIFDRFSLKKKIALSKKHKISDDLSSEAVKNSELIKQIKELQNQRQPDQAGPRSAYFLKSDSWYTQKLAEELQNTETKQKFIEQELTEIKRKIAIDHQNVSKAEAKSKEIKKKEGILRETKLELLTPKINKV
tara:strand:+ start:740 stop:1156 length:417 start_codon:yes stop_codon:yes gene_type:complete